MKTFHPEFSKRNWAIGRKMDFQGVTDESPLLRLRLELTLSLLSLLGNVFSWRDNQWNHLGFHTEEEDVSSPQMIPFFSEKGLKVEEVVASSGNSFFLCEGGELFGAGRAGEGRLGNPELKTNPETPILINTDVERLFTGPSAMHVFFTKLDESVWSFGNNGYNQRGFEGNGPNDRGTRFHKDLASNEIVKIACGFNHTLIIKKGGRIYGAGWRYYICGIPTFFVREENSLELVWPKMEDLGILSSKQLQTLLSLSLKMLRGFSQVHQHAKSSLQSLMKVFGLLEGTS